MKGINQRWFLIQQGRTSNKRCLAGKKSSSSKRRDTTAAAKTDEKPGSPVGWIAFVPLCPRNDFRDASNLVVPPTTPQTFQQARENERIRRQRQGRRWQGKGILPPRQGRFRRKGRVPWRKRRWPRYVSCRKKSFVVGWVWVFCAASGVAVHASARAGAARVLGCECAVSLHSLLSRVAARAVCCIALARA